MNINTKYAQKIGNYAFEEEQALAFLKLLAPDAIEYHFRTFDDTDQRRRELAKNFSGSLETHITTLRESNEKGAGVFVVVNEGGQSKAEITRIRAVFADTDGAALEPLLELELKPHVVIESSPRRWHVYWMVSDDFPLNRFSQVQTTIADKFGTDKHVADLPRVMRLPGFFHNKATPFMVKPIHFDQDQHRYSLEEITKCFGVDDATAEPVQEDSENANQDYPFEGNRKDFYAALCKAFPNPLDREEWRTGLCALAYLVVAHKWPEEEARKIREEWESLAISADKTENATQWEDAIKRTRDKLSRGESVTTHLTVLKTAHQKGWIPSSKILHDAMESVQAQYALIQLGGKLGVVDHKSLNRFDAMGAASKLEVMSRSDGRLMIERLLKNQFPDFDSGKKASEFFTSPDTTCYSGVEFNPRNTSPGFLNLWVGPTISPQWGDWSHIRDFLFNVICSGHKSEYDYLVGYLAHAIQRPWEKPGVVVILLGGQGIGKGTLGSILRRIWSATYLHIHQIRAIVGDFNGALERSFIVFLDEALFVGDHNSTDAFKSIATEPVLNINEKHQPARQIQSYHRFFAATNANHFKATDRDDRRDFVLRVSENRKGDHAFWAALNHEIENGGVEALAHDLMLHDLTGFNVRAKPNTRELTEQKLQSLEKFPRWWFDCLSRGYVNPFNTEWPDFVSTTTLLDEFKESEKGSRTYKLLIERDIAAYIEKLCPTAYRQQAMEGAYRRRGFMLPPLHIARDAFEKYIGDAVEWDEFLPEDYDPDEHHYEPEWEV